MIRPVYFQGDSRAPRATAAVDARGRAWHFTAKDNKVTLGKLARGPPDVKGSDALVERCRARSGVASLSWRWFGRDVIEVDLSDIDNIDRVLEAYIAEGFLIRTVNYW
jgi:hypothetical protein